jgi:hypothetical protein
MFSLSLVAHNMPSLLLVAHIVPGSLAHGAVPCIAHDDV